MTLQVQFLELRLPLDAAAGVASQAVVALADTVAPEVRSVTAPKSQTYAAGKTLSFKVNFSEPVVATGVPTLPITIGTAVRQASWNGKGSGGTSLTFTVVVQAGDLAPTGVRIAGSIGLADGAAIRDRAGNALIPAATGTFPKAKVDAVGPRVTEFGSPVFSGKLVSLRVTFDEAVRVTGNPSIPFTLAGVPKQFVYTSGSGRNVLTFQYKAAKGEAPSADTVAFSSPAITLGTSRLTDTAGNAATSLTSPNVPTPGTSMQFVTVGDAGNAADDTGYGAVDYVYRIGRFEVTIGQYTEFLNAVAANDPHGLYNTNMGTNLNVAGISRSGSPGSYTYRVIGPFGETPAGADSPGNRPITYVSWTDAARFANWMHNGMPTGPDGATSTEFGAYTLNGATSGWAPARNAGARFHIPTVDEWYKAAFYKGSGTSAGYWDYATRSNDLGDANIDAIIQFGGPYSASRNYLTNVGSFTNSSSAYGTFDQNGNVSEWNALRPGDINTSWQVGIAGIAWRGSHSWQASATSFGGYRDPSTESDLTGFRLASAV